MVNEAELKVKIFRLVDAQDGETLEEMYKLLLERLQSKSQWASPDVLCFWEDEREDLYQDYAAMAADEEREVEATEWAEGTLNHEEL